MGGTHSSRRCPEECLEGVSKAWEADKLPDDNTTPSPFNEVDVALTTDMHIKPGPVKCSSFPTTQPYKISLFLGTSDFPLCDLWSCTQELPQEVLPPILFKNVV